MRLTLNAYERDSVVRTRVGTWSERRLMALALACLASAACVVRVEVTHHYLANPEPPAITSKC
jgi:hypothetical protein